MGREGGDMGKRMFILRMSMVGVAVVALLFGGPALADTANCTFMDSLGRGNATLTTVPGPDGWPVYVAASGTVPEHWEYRYQLGAGLGTPVPALGTAPSVDFLIPTCAPPLSITGTGVTVYPAGNPPGAGSRFGSWTGHDNVVRVRTGSGPSNIIFSTPSLLPLRDVSAGLVTGTTTSSYLCRDIVAPFCPGAPGQAFQQATINTCMQMEGKNILIVRNPNHCITELRNCGPYVEGQANDCSGTCAPLYANVRVEVTCVGAPGTCQQQDAFTSGDILGNQICPEAILFSASSPGCSNVRTLSGWVQVCR